MIRQVSTWLAQMLAIIAMGTAVLIAESQGPEQGCKWSSEWIDLSSRFPPAPNGAKITGNARRKKGSIVRPASAFAHSIRGVWKVEAVVDEKGDVRDAKIIEKPAIEPPWPEYERAILESIEKYQYSPVKLDGQPWPNCMTITVHEK